MCGSRMGIWVQDPQGEIGTWVEIPDGEIMDVDQDQSSRKHLSMVYQEWSTRCRLICIRAL